MTGRRLTGAALRARVIAECRRMLADDYGLPMSEYAVNDTYTDAYSLGSDMQPVMTVTFDRLGSDGTPCGPQIQVTEIHPADDGTLQQYGSNYGRLAY